MKKATAGRGQTDAQQATIMLQLEQPYRAVLHNSAFKAFNPYNAAAGYKENNLQTIYLCVYYTSDL